jgi:hypothetical protein
MPKFKVGDKVIRTKSDCHNVKQGCIYTVKTCPDNTNVNFVEIGDDFYLSDLFDLVSSSSLPTDRPLTYDETQMLKKGDVVKIEGIRSTVKEVTKINMYCYDGVCYWDLNATKNDVYFISHGKEESKEEKKEEVKDFGLSETAKGFIKTQAEQRVVDKMAGRNGLEKLDYESMEAHINAHKEFLKRSTTKSVSQIIYGR